MILILDGDNPDPKTKSKMSEAEFIATFVKGHEDHPWRQVGRCVYCQCGQRLYQGTIPAGHPVATTAPSKGVSASDKMRELWGKV